MSEEVQIAVCGNILDAEAVKSLLEENEVNAWLMRDDGDGTIPGQTFVQGIKVMINVEDKETAKELLKQATADTSEDPAWKCSKCGEEIEGQFSDCWSCGNSKLEK
ncbi:MAG: DUF2007 domain-containing protein [Fibrobacteria bacterium]|nr:DUF2007 domain-containing protein [Fibrobacteria bacterium]